MDAESDEFTPHDLGLLAGHAWAVEPEAAARVAEENIVPPDVMDPVLAAGVRERLQEFDDVDAAEGDFWRGFLPRHPRVRRRGPRPRRRAN